jgi:3-deoxy-D-manno-octulosonic-acid transferase
MRLIYDLGVRIYYLFILLASPFNPKARMWISGRKKLLERLAGHPDIKQSMIWFHCSSLGEFEQGRPVIEQIRREFPGKKILLTFYSPSGYEVRKNYDEADCITYLPLDTRHNAEKFLNLFQIEKAYFVKYEFWYHFLAGLHKRRIPVYLVSGIFRKNQAFFKWYGSWYRKMLQRFDHLFVQQSSSLSLLKEYGINNASVSGDTRFDRVYEIVRKVIPDERFKVFCRDYPVIVSGSTWPRDEEVIIRYINESGRTCKWFIVPHEIHESGISRIMEQVRKNSARYTEISGADLENTDVLVIDAIGLLSSLYRLASIAYIGGGFGKGIHNTLEAAAFGKPVLFGPNYHKFQEAKDLVLRDAAIPIAGFKDFKTAIDRFLDDPGLLKKTGESSGTYVKSMLGASSLIVDYTLKTKDF